ncbi:Vacuolar protease A [Elasticomyces elasticus]|nr:Vacuolar protease A [Elasticomyces elasticus]
MVDMHSLPAGSRPLIAVRNRGPDALALERFKLRELAEGWPMYRDACEWENLKSLFHDEAYIYTTWTGRTHFRDFIKASQKGMDNGVFIMHRCHGASTDINLDATRAVTKLKATITQRFEVPAGEVDTESDCRFCFFWSRDPCGEWRAKYVRHWYEKDKLIPVTPGVTVEIDPILLAQFPHGYRYLAYLQEMVMGVKVARDLPGHRRDVSAPGGFRTCGEAHDQLLWQCKDWLDGQDIDM